MTPAFPKVYRYLDKPDLRGRLCRIVAKAERRPGHMNIGNETVEAEFEDGTRIFTKKAGLYEASSIAGKRIIASRARGFTLKSSERPRTAAH